MASLSTPLHLRVAEPIPRRPKRRNLTRYPLRRNSNMLRSQLQNPLPPLCEYDELYYDGVATDFICWEGFGSTGEVKSAELGSSMVQSKVYMEQQRLAQPHLQFVLGLAITGRELALTRADGMGVEHLTVRVSEGRGAMEVVRVAFAFAFADDSSLGCAPGFGLRERTCLRFVGREQKLEASVQRNRPDIGPATQILSEEFNGIHSKKTTPFPVFFSTPKDDTGKEERYYLDYLVDNRGSLIGRQIRLWCAYRKITSAQDLRFFDVRDKDQTKEALEKATEVFVGPFALKIQNIKKESIGSQMSLSTEIKKAVEEDLKSPDEKKRMGTSYILPLLQIYQSIDIMETVRGFRPGNIPTVIQDTLQYQEMVSVSHFKRTLRQYQCIGEVARAATDAIRGIEWLRSHGWLHRDISDGNFLLAREDPSMFHEPFFPEKGILLCRRPLCSQKNMFGLLHDFDMAGFVDPVGFLSAT